MSHLLVTNDFPPKVGGIQTYLGELWRRLPPGEAHVLTTAHPEAAAWDRGQALPIRRLPAPVLLPTPALARAVRREAAECGAELAVLDPALPLGLVGRDLGMPYAVVVHGAEVTVPGRLPGARQLLARVLREATGIIAAGGYPEAVAGRIAAALPDVVQVPPGVDTDRFRPLDAAQRAAARSHLGLPAHGQLIVGASRLVPRKGFDVLIEAMTRLLAHRPGLTLALAGAGRDRGRLERLAGRYAVPVTFLGRLPDEDLPALYGAADVFAMLCRDRWGGLEQEGFGIVFLEAAACGVPQVAGDSGGAVEAVLDGSTGFLVADPLDAGEAAKALARLLDDPDLARRMGATGRARVEASFSWGRLAQTLGAALQRWEQ